EPLGVMPGRTERRLRFSELRMDDQRPFGTYCPRYQRKGLRASRRRECLINSDSVGLHNGLCGGIGAGIGSEMRDSAVDYRAEPIRRSRQSDVDGQIHQTFGDVAISVMVKIMDGAAGGGHCMIMNGVG